MWSKLQWLNQTQNSIKDCRWRYLLFTVVLWLRFVYIGASVVNDKQKLCTEIITFITPYLMNKTDTCSYLKPVSYSERNRYTTLQGRPLVGPVNGMSDHQSGAEARPL